ncbi:dUTP diphosphatase [uncultured Corynebacterium sp.]|uniref:dUTP diphosphatase n=1 Tax=uncultured Corynebacterium sp. TaxID=159447 RepID=UPI0025964EC1|nr:dUTP diphosphatase [uncultured Corynebacterium sp.]
MKYTGEFELKRATGGSAGFDLSVNEDVILAPGEHDLVSTGTRVAIPDGHVGFVFTRSSLGARYGIALRNGTGVIDSDYRGEIALALVNNGADTIALDRGERVAQLVVVPFHGEAERVETLDGTERGEGGFGSTGR